MAQSMVGVTRVNIFEPICVVVDAMNTDYKMNQFVQMTGIETINSLFRITERA